MSRWRGVMVALMVAVGCDSGKSANTADLANPNADLSSLNPNADLSSLNLDLSGQDLTESGGDLALVATISPPSGIWTSSGGGAFTAASGAQASFSIGGQTVYGVATSGGAIVTMGYLSSDTY